MKDNKPNLKKLTAEECIAFAKALQPGDSFFVEGKDFVAKMIEFGTGDKDGIGPGDIFNPCHVGVYSGQGRGETIEADGNSVAQHLIADYFPGLMQGKVRIVVMRPVNLTIDELERMKLQWKSMLGQRYNYAILFWFGVWGLLNKIPGLGSLAGKIRNPGYKPNSPVCSIATAKIILAVERLRPALKDKPIENRTPENLFDSLRDSNLFGIALDTLNLTDCK